MTTWEAKITLPLTLHNHNYVSSYVSNLPPIISSEGFLLPDGGEIGPWNDRISWDHTFSPNLLNSMTYGYMNTLGSEIAVDAEFAGQLPQIAGVASHAQPPAIQFSAGFESMGQDLLHHEDRPTSVFNDLLTWVRGRHTFKFGGEIRKLQNNFQSVSNRSGTFSFSEGETGLLGINSGNPIASFLLGAVDYSSAAFDTVTSSYSRGSYWALFAGDTWKATNKLSIDYGLRWDLGTPATEKWNRSSFLDPLGANPVRADGQDGWPLRDRESPGGKITELLVFHGLTLSIPGTVVLLRVWASPMPGIPRRLCVRGTVSS
jgi:outer membrane receptor protein involved in Fe transport